MEKTQYIREIKEKDPVHSPFIIKYSSLASGKNSKPYLNLILMDQSGELEGRIWEDAHKYLGQIVRDAICMVEGKCQIYQGRRQIIVNQIRVLREDEVDLKKLIPQSNLDPDTLYSQLLNYVDSMQDPYYRALAESILRDDPEIASKIKRAPAAKSVHHAYRGGLLEHIVSITGILDLLASHYQGVLDRDLLFLGGFFHDIGKIWELSYDRVTDYTTEGKLVGHLVMGVELIERKVQELELKNDRIPGPFPTEKKLLVKHLILAHHGQREYGSPKRPKTLEALVVHMIDDLDSKINSIRVFMEQDMNPGEWTGLNKQYERFFLKPDWLQNQNLK